MSRSPLSGISVRAMTVRAIVCAVLVCGSALAAPRVAAGQHAAAAPFIDDGTMTVVTDNSAADLDPASDEFYGSDTIARNIDDELIAFDHASINRYIPKLATSWSHNANYSV